MTTRSISLLGATGSIGDSTLDVVLRHPDRFAVVALAARSQWEKLAVLCRRFSPKLAALLDETPPGCSPRRLRAPASGPASSPVPRG